MSNRRHVGIQTRTESRRSRGPRFEPEATAAEDTEDDLHDNDKGL